MFTTLFLKGPVRKSVPQVTAVSFYSLQERLGRKTAFQSVKGGRLGLKISFPEGEGRETGPEERPSKGPGSKK